MPGYVVYIDKVILGNLLINYLILWATAKLGRVKTIPWQLLAGATIGSLYSLTLFFPFLKELLTIKFKLVISILMVFIAYAPQPPKKLLTCLVIFYLVSFALGGFAFGLIYFFREEVDFETSIYGILSIIDRHFWYGLLIALATLWGIVKLGPAILYKRLVISLAKVPIGIKIWDKQVYIEALLDTGNQLTDPLTQEPVIIVEYSALKTLLPIEIQQLYESGEEPDVMKVWESLSDSRWATRFRVIPYCSLSQKGGLLIGFKPDKLEIWYKGCKPISTQKVIVAICLKQLSTESLYQALLSPQLLEPAA